MKKNLSVIILFNLAPTGTLKFSSPSSTYHTYQHISGLLLIILKLMQQVKINKNVYIQYIFCPNKYLLKSISPQAVVLIHYPFQDVDYNILEHLGYRYHELLFYCEPSLTTCLIMLLRVQEVQLQQEQLLMQYLQLTALCFQWQPMLF